MWINKRQNGLRHVVIDASFLDNKYFIFSCNSNHLRTESFKFTTKIMLTLEEIGHLGWMQALLFGLRGI